MIFFLTVKTVSQNKHLVDNQGAQQQQILGITGYYKKNNTQKIQAILDKLEIDPDTQGKLQAIYSENTLKILEKIYQYCFIKGILKIIDAEEKDVSVDIDNPEDLVILNDNNDTGEIVPNNSKLDDQHKGDSHTEKDVSVDNVESFNDFRAKFKAAIPIHCERRQARSINNFFIIIFTG